MAGKRDDFAWILELVHAARRGSPRGPQRGASYETVEQLYERRVNRRRKWRSIIILILQIALPFIIFLLLF